MNNIEIGQRIKQQRIETGMSLQDIADLTGVARSTIQRYETGKIDKLKLPVIESIARALNVRPDWIIGKTDEKFLKSNVHPKILSYYNKLNTKGQEIATEQVRLLTLDEKYTKPDNVISIVKEPDPDYLAPNAAHSNDGATQEEIQHDADIMDNDEEWN